MATPDEGELAEAEKLEEERWKNYATHGAWKSNKEIDDWFQEKLREDDTTLLEQSPARPEANPVREDSE